MAVLTYTKTGNKATIPAKLDKKIFGVMTENHELLKTAYVAYLANGRENFARAQTRSEVRGGGRKPWKQKGTGRARFGSSRNPIWRGGGVAFGPTGEENYSHKLPTKAKRQAIRQALSLAANDNKLIIIETFDPKEGKAGATVKLLQKIGVRGSVLLVVSNKDDLIERATRNLTDVKVVQARYMNVYDLMNADSIVMGQEALSIVHEWLKPSAKAKAKGEEKDG